MRLIGLAVVLTVSVLVPFAAEAQQAAKSARIGYLSPDLAVNPHLHEAFRQGLRDLGYVEGRNLVIEFRSAEGKFERLPALAAELVALKVDVIVVPSTAPALAAKQATRTLPIVFLRGRAAMSRGRPSSPRSSSAKVWNCSSRPFQGSVGSLSSGTQVARANARKRTC
jgi:ABC-type uncharacterized transport system substrate-binding protein